MVAGTPNGKGNDAAVKTPVNAVNPPQGHDAHPPAPTPAPIDKSGDTPQSTAPSSGPVRTGAEARS